MSISTIENTGKELLREYMWYDVRRFYLEKKLEEEIIEFIYKFFESTIDLLVFLNDSGKYIVVETYSGQYFSKRLIKGICDKYNVTYEGCSKKVHIDYEGEETLSKLTYLFEIVKDYDEYSGWG